MTSYADIPMNKNNAQPMPGVGQMGTPSSMAPVQQPSSLGSISPEMLRQIAANQKAQEQSVTNSALAKFMEIQNQAQ